MKQRTERTLGFSFVKVVKRIRFISHSTRLAESKWSEDLSDWSSLAISALPTITVQVLNDSIETFNRMPVDLVLENSDGNIQVPFKAFTCLQQITGSYNVVDWKRRQQCWPHLQVCNFPKATADPLVDVLIGQDQVELHYARCDVTGEPGEPIARLRSIRVVLYRKSRKEIISFWSATDESGLHVLCKTSTTRKFESVIKEVLGGRIGQVGTRTSSNVSRREICAGSGT